MKTRYPKNLIQAFILLFIPILFSVPLLFFFNLAEIEVLYFTVYFLFVLSISYFINKKRRKYLPKKIVSSKKYENRIVLYLFVVLLLYMLGVTPMLSQINLNKFISGNISTLSFENINLIKAISIIIFAPIMEELLFRNIILKGFLDNYKSAIKAILYSSLIFAVVHLMPNQIINAFFLGVLLGVLFYVTNNVVYTIIFHSLSNILGLNTSFFNKLFSTSAMVLVFALCLVIISLLIFHISRIIRQTV